MLVAIDAEPANRKQRTGTENVAFNLIRELIKLEGENHERRYVLYTRENLRSDWPRLPANFAHKKLPWFLPLFWSQFRLGLAVRQLRPDVFFVPSHSLPLFHSGRIVTIVHDIGFLDRPELYSAKARLYHRYSLSRALRRAQIIIVPSQAVLDSLHAKFSHLPTVLVIPWGVEHEKFSPSAQPDDEKILSEFELEPGKYFFYLGRIETKKNLPVLIQAYRTYRQQGGSDKLVLVGSNAQNLDVGQATWLGYQSQEVTSVLYRYARAFVFPSNYEGFGLPILEAQASGCPVIASDLPVLQEVSGGAAKFFNPAEPDSLSQAMFELSQDANLVRILRQKGLENAGPYSWQRTGEKVREIIGQVGKDTV